MRWSKSNLTEIGLKLIERFFCLVVLKIFLQRIVAGLVKSFTVYNLKCGDLVDNFYAHSVSVISYSKCPGPGIWMC